MKNLNGRSGASLIKETVYSVEKGTRTYYVDLIANGKYAISIDEKYLCTKETKDEAINYVNSKM